MKINKHISRDFDSNKNFVYQTATAKPVQTSQTPVPGIPDSLKKKAETNPVIFDEKTKKEANKMGILQRLKATLFPVKAPKTATSSPAGTSGKPQKEDPKNEAQKIREAEKI